MKTLSGKIVLITGASSGIGAAAAAAFDREGATVVLVARRKEKLEKIASGLQNAIVYPADLSDEIAVRSMIRNILQKTDRIDILINNAACIIVSPAETVSPDDMLKAFRTNLLGPMAAIQELLPVFRRQGGGHIINVGSPGFLMGIPFYAPYAASKAAFSALTRSLQAEIDEPGIFISEYFPGYIKTDSRPESRVGEVEQDLLMESEQNFLTRTFAKPKTAEFVANQLVKLALNPKPLAWSGFGVRLGSVISNFSGFRLSIARQMAKTATKKIQNNSN